MEQTAVESVGTESTKVKRKPIEKNENEKGGTTGAKEIRSKGSGAEKIESGGKKKKAVAREREAT